MAELLGPDHTEAGPTPSDPVPFGPDVAANLSLAKRDALIPAEGKGETNAIQFGAAYLDVSVPLPPHDPARTVSEPLIDMFVCTEDGSCTPTGSDESLIELWRPSVTALADGFFLAMSEHTVPVASTVYITASLTPTVEVIGQGHFDDDQYVPDDGVGVVAIVGSDAGPRIATEPVPVGIPTAGLPLKTEPSVFDRFTRGTIAHQQAEAGRVVVFPQFAQLHSGPPLDADQGDRYRRLLVLRTETTPITTS